MKSAILWELNKDLEVRDDVRLTDLAPDDVHIKVVSSGVCHSDLSIQNGTLPLDVPSVLGHEGAGIVQEVGKAVTDVAPGDHIIQFSSFEFFFSDKTLRGSMYGSANVRTFMPMLCRLWRVRKLDLEGMITRRIQLEEVNDAFRAMQEGEVIRSVIDFN